jgi:hypothetical protein
MSYPEKCLRGIINESFLEDGKVTSPLFYFDNKHRRPDGWIELSINWHDDDNAIDSTLKQRRESGELKFKAGVAILPRKGLDEIKMWDSIGGRLAYERQPLSENKYHGNILLNHEVSPRIAKMIAASIALTTSQIIPQYNE